MIKHTGFAFVFVLAACGGPPVEEVQPSPLSAATPIPTDRFNADEFAYEVEALDESDWTLQFTDPDPVIRQEAIDLLAESGDLRHRDMLELALSDPHAGVREAAFEALEELGINLEDEPL